jgi:hypothetical protein
MPAHSVRSRTVAAVLPAFSLGRNDPVPARHPTISSTALHFFIALPTSNWQDNRRHRSTHAPIADIQKTNANPASLWASFFFPLTRNSQVSCFETRGSKPKSPSRVSGSLRCVHFPRSCPVVQRSEGATSGTAPGQLRCIIYPWAIWVSTGSSPHVQQRRLTSSWVGVVSAGLSAYPRQGDLACIGTLPLLQFLTLCG